MVVKVKGRGPEEGILDSRHKDLRELVLGPLSILQTLPRPRGTKVLFNSLCLVALVSLRHVCDWFSPLGLEAWRLPCPPPTWTPPVAAGSWGRYVRSLLCFLHSSCLGCPHSASWGPGVTGVDLVRCAKMALQMRHVIPPLGVPGSVRLSQKKALGTLRYPLSA